MNIYRPSNLVPLVYQLFLDNPNVLLDIKSVRKILHDHYDRDENKKRVYFALNSLFTLDKISKEFRGVYIKKNDRQEDLCKHK